MCSWDVEIFIMRFTALKHYSKLKRISWFNIHDRRPVIDNCHDKLPDIR